MNKNLWIAIALGVLAGVIYAGYNDGKNGA
jgi:hypothetical protein